jgi:hypothetical protein
MLSERGGLSVRFMFSVPLCLCGESVAKVARGNLSHCRRRLVILDAMALDDPDNPLMVEIRQEMAATYFAACKKMVDSLEALKAFDGAAASSPQSHERVTRRSELLDEAAERVYFVVIQREAMKLSGYQEFFEDYEVPAEVRARLGPRRRE